MIFWFWTKALNTNKLGCRQFSLLISNMRPTECFHCWYALVTITLARIWFWAWNFKCDERILTSRIIDGSVSLSTLGEIWWRQFIWNVWCSLLLSFWSFCYTNIWQTHHETWISLHPFDSWNLCRAVCFKCHHVPNNKGNLGFNSTFPHVHLLSSRYATLSTST